jgi:8-oxo-dGTP pyrophosphatase MutT (NUDIX family)
VNKMDFSKEPKVAQWKELLQAAGCVVKSLSPLHLLHKPNGELLFALCEAAAVDPDGKELPRYIFIRGHACIVVVLLKNAATGEERYLMIRQRRTGNGSLNLEFPAGMLDRNINSPETVAVRELYEETGLSLSEVDLHPLYDGLLYSSPGACDEGIYYFGCITTVPDDRFKSFIGRRASCSDDENIEVTLRTRDEAESETLSLQARLGFYLFADYLRKIRRMY